jgi:small subunit ribosomal protein S16
MPLKPAHFTIRLARRGCRNRPFFQIAVMPNKANCLAHPTEQIGSYDPMPNSRNEKLVAFNFERVGYWLARGATCSKPVMQLLGMYFVVL